MQKKQQPQTVIFTRIEAAIIPNTIEFYVFYRSGELHFHGLSSIGKNRIYFFTHPSMDFTDFFTSVP